MAFVLLSAIAFGAMAVFGKLAFGDGTTVGTLLVVRFALAASVLWGWILVRDGRAALRGVTRRDVLIALALGGAGYAGQAGAYFAALQRIDASLLSLVLYTYPAMVALAAVMLGRERLDGRRATALALASGGLVLVVAGAGTGALEAVGVALALGAAVIYTTYILTSQGVSGRLDPHRLSALVCTGAAVTLLIGSTALGQFRPGDVTAGGWGWLAALALISTVAAVALFFAGLRRVGPTSAAILSTLEPVTTVVLAMLVFGEVLSPVQAFGGALVLGGVLVLNLRLGRPWAAARPSAGRGSPARPAAASACTTGSSSG